MENQGYQIDRDGDLQLEESFMFNVAGHIKKDLYEKTDDEMHEVLFTISHRVSFSFRILIRNQAPMHDTYIMEMKI